MGDYTHKTVLITGASGGIGEVFAREFAKQGAHLVLVARSEDKLKKIAEELNTEYEVAVKIISADLSKARSGRDLYLKTSELGVSVDVLINNAGFGTHGNFEKIDIEKQYDEVMLNVTALMELTHLYIRDMAENESGTVVNVASTAAFQPIPYMAVYGATKAFVLSFSEALHGEYRKRGVHVMALCPGSTKTNFFNTVGTMDASVGSQKTPEYVVAKALKAIRKKKSHIVTGGMNKLMVFSTRFLPLPVVAAMAGSMVRLRD